MRFSPVADHGLLVEVAIEIGDEASDRVMALDRALTQANIDGIDEIVPAYVNLLIAFDPVRLDHRQVQTIVEDLMPALGTDDRQPTVHEISVCYDGEFGRDIEAVATATAMSPEAVIARHLEGDYRVALFGFAPGYAYLSGVPAEIQVPRKAAAVPGVAAGSVIIAGPQCLITTLEMPTGWSILGRSPRQILRAGGADQAVDDHAPTIFEMGDRLRFVRVDRTTFDRELSTTVIRP